MARTTITGEGLVQFATWNAKGLNSAVTRSWVLTRLKKLKVDIVFLQETHLRNQDHDYLHKGWVGQVYHSFFQFKSREVAILIGKNSFFF